MLSWAYPGSPPRDSSRQRAGLPALAGGPVALSGHMRLVKPGWRHGLAPLTGGNLGFPGPSLGGWFRFGLRPPSAEGLSWPAPLSLPLRPPMFSRTGGLPLYPRRGLRPLHPARGMKEASLSYLGASGTLPQLPARGERDPLPNLPPSTGAGTGLAPCTPLGETKAP